MRDPIVIGLFVHVSVRPVRKKWFSPFNSSKVWYIHLTCTNNSSWHDVLIPHGCLCPWPTFHASVTMVRKKWLSQYYRTCWCLFTKLRPTIHLDMIYWCHVVVCGLDLHFMLEWPWLEWNVWVYITVPIGATFTKLAPTVHLDMIYWCHVVVNVLDQHFTLERPRSKMAIAGPLWWFP